METLAPDFIEVVDLFLENLIPWIQPVPNELIGKISSVSMTGFRVG